MNIYFHTFGCKVNQCETGSMANKALAAGVELCRPENADIIVINSCTVTAEADRKARQHIRRFSRVNPGAKILFTGCYVDRAERELKNEFPNVVFFANSRKENILKYLAVPEGSGSCEPFASYGGHTRAFIKIQDGCDGNCAYCIVPKIRNKISFKNPAEVIREAAGYAEAGHKEIVLCGVRLGKYSWKKGEGRGNLTELLKELEKIEGIKRIRLSSIDFNDITPDLIRLMASSKKMCRHLHIPLQSGNDETLKNMRRPYNTKTFFEKIKFIRKSIPDIGITTDIMAGFPTETDENFKESSEFIKKCGFSRLHIFRFSPRPGTDAAKMKAVFREHQIAGREKALKSLDAELRQKFLKKFKGKKMEVLAESNGRGYTSNYIYVKLPAGAPVNELIKYEQK